MRGHWTIDTEQLTIQGRLVSQSSVNALALGHKIGSKRADDDAGMLGISKVKADKSLLPDAAIP